MELVSKPIFQSNQANDLPRRAPSVGEDHGGDAGQGQEHVGRPEVDERVVQEGRTQVPPGRKAQRHVLGRQKGQRFDSRV